MIIMVMDPLANLLGISFTFNLQNNKMFYYQIFNLNFKKPSNCLMSFKSNNLVGILIFIQMLVGKI